MKNKKSGIWFLLLTVMALSAGAFTGCGTKPAGNVQGQSKEAEEIGTGKELKTVTIGQASAGELLGGIASVAQKEGFIEEELNAAGYKPEYIGFAGAGPEVNEAFAGNKIDFAFAGNLPPIVARSNGINVSVINVVDSDLHMAFLAQKEDDSVNGPEDLEGKTVLVGKGTILQYLFGVVIDEYGLDPDKIKVVNTVADATAAFLNGDVDVYIATDIQAQLLVSGGDGKIIFNTSDRPEWSSQQVLAARNEFLATDPEAAVALEKAIIRAYEFANAYPEKAYEDFTLEGKYTVDLIKKVYSENNGGNGRFEFAKGDIAEADIEKLAGLCEFLYTHEIITARVDAKELVNTEYYEQALKELGK